jgi:cobalamin-dependent methionine synthase I
MIMPQTRDREITDIESKVSDTKICKEIIHKEAIAQVQAGADLIDVNVSTAWGRRFTSSTPNIQVVMNTVYVPLCLDSANPKPLEAALKVYKGKPLINSVTGCNGGKHSC